ALTYEAFGEGSFAPRAALLSIGAPLYHYVDTSAYIAPLALFLAIIAIVSAFRRRGGDVRLWFWLAVAIGAFPGIVGTYTPFSSVIYPLPVINQFRVPSRHTFEWTLAVSVLAAYGWDAVADYFARRQRIAISANRVGVIIACALLLTGAVIAALWWRGTAQPPVPNPTIYTGLPEGPYS